MSIFPIAVAVAQMMAGERADLPKNDVARSREVMASFAQCLAQRQPKVARTFVLDDYSAAANRLYRQGGVNDCLSDASEMRFQALAARGAMAEVLIAREFPGMPELKWDGVTLAGPSNAALLPQGGVSLPPRTDPTQTRIVLIPGAITLGACILRADAAKSRTLLNSKLNSKAETAAVAAITPSISACVPKGETLKIDKSGIRTGIAVAYYRLAHAPNGGPK